MYFEIRENMYFVSWSIFKNVSFYFSWWCLVKLNIYRWDNVGNTVTFQPELKKQTNIDFLKGSKAKMFYKLVIISACNICF